MATMKAIVVHKQGDSSEMKYEDVPIPQPGENEALVKNHICGINYIDVYQRNGHFPLANLPAALGMEGAGTVEKLGPGAEGQGVAIGDRVTYVHIGSGSYAEYSVLPAGRLVKLPSDISYEQAATSMIQGMTAHYLVHTISPVQPGNKVLVHAAAGGTGSLVCQVAKNAGAYVIGTTSTKEKADKARACGADEVILYSQKDFVQEVNRITDGKGVNVIYDGVGKTTFVKGFQCLATCGTNILFGHASGTPGPLDLGLLSAGSYSVVHPKVFDYVVSTDDLRKRAATVFAWLSKGSVKMDSFTVLPLSEAKKAHDLLEGKKTTGKLLLKT